MKLRNKKTGKIKEVDPLVIGGFQSLAELNEEWEDYEEPLVDWVWYMDLQGSVGCAAREENDWSRESEIGNYFETKEEAELAVDKLKAWKRLKDKGFRFDGWDENHHCLGVIEFSFPNAENSVYDFKQDLDLLFGGEE